MTTQSVTVRFFAAARAATGVAETQATAGALVDVLRELEQRFPGLAAVAPRCSFLVDGLAAASPEGVDVAPGSTVDVLPPFAGG